MLANTLTVIHRYMRLNPKYLYFLKLFLRSAYRYRGLDFRRGVSLPRIAVCKECAVQKSRLIASVLLCGFLAASQIVSAASADFIDRIISEDTQKSPSSRSVSAKAVTFGKTLWSFDDKGASSFTVKSGKSKNSYVLNQLRGSENPLTAQTGDADLITQSGRHRLARPATVTFKDKERVMELQYGKKEPVRVEVTLKAVDVVGLKIRDFLKQRDGSLSDLASSVGNKTFPAGSVAFIPTVRIKESLMLLPLRSSFTNAANKQELIENFSDVPFCLTYEKRNGAKAVGLVFDKSQRGKTAGTVTVIPVRNDTIFCKPSGEKPSYHASWNYVRTAQHSAVVIRMPDNIDPRDYGLKTHEKGYAKFAFIAPSNGDRVFRPGKYIAKGTVIQSKRYLFNERAASAIRSALN